MVMPCLSFRTNPYSQNVESHKVYLSLGSNLGDRHALLEQAIDLLQQRVGHITAVSSFLETEPWGFDSPNTFLNAAVRLTTLLSPLQLLLVTQQIERGMGRAYKSDPLQPQYHDRPIDIDILMYDDLELDEAYEVDGQILRLTLPHPHMLERDFVMIPLREILSEE